MFGLGRGAPQAPILAAAVGMVTNNSILFPNHPRLQSALGDIARPGPLNRAPGAEATVPREVPGGSAPSSPSTPSGGEGPAWLADGRGEALEQVFGKDFARAARDPLVFNRIMRDPKLRAALEQLLTGAGLDANTPAQSLRDFREVAGLPAPPNGQLMDPTTIAELALRQSQRSREAAASPAPAARGGGVAAPRVGAPAPGGATPTGRFLTDQGRGPGTLSGSPAGAQGAIADRAVGPSGAPPGSDAAQAGATPARTAGAVASTTGELAGRDNAQKVVNYFIAKGLTPEQAKGIAANALHESGANPARHQDRGPAFGLLQWEGSRRTELERFAAARGKPASDLATQLDFTWHELQTTERAAFGALKGARTTEEATRIFSDEFERPGIPHMERRLEHARDLDASGLW